MTGHLKLNLTPLGHWRWIVFALLIMCVLLLTVIPIILQFMGSMMTLFGFFTLEKVWTFSHWKDALTEVTFLRTLGNTIILGLSTALAAVVLYSIVAYCSVRLRSKWRGTIDILSWIPFTIPGVILGLGYLWMTLQVPFIQPLYGTMGVLILISWLATITLGVQLFKTNMIQLGMDIEEAGRIVGGSWFKTFKNIVIPLTAPTMITIGVMVFATTVRQVSTIILLSTGKTNILPVLQLEFLSAGSLGPAAVVGSVIVAITLLASLCIKLIGERYGVKR